MAADGQEPTVLIGLTSLVSEYPMPSKFNRRRAVFVLGKIDETLAWEQRKEMERDTKFVDLGRYLCEVRAGQHWRLEKLGSSRLAARSGVGSSIGTSRRSVKPEIANFLAQFTRWFNLSRFLEGSLRRTIGGDRQRLEFSDPLPDPLDLGGERTTQIRSKEDIAMLGGI